ncbi:hypothetical protein A9Q84_03070 [Halobacteriovorax marinus]|uniref:Peptidase S8/S53 domain-containing protein n=1 Tax=Halobacteriovorax marinus TaxID=97084 RepID=A0A1Y5FDB6_9BACT|nr:hypothetical protein A9Q84_03070 [Halobacteriovorax marinus]
MLRVVLALLSTTTTMAAICPTTEFVFDDYGYRTEFICENGKLSVESEYHIKSGNLVSLRVHEFLNGVTEEKSWSVDGNYTYHAKYKYVTDNVFQKIILDTSSGKLKGKEEFKYVNGEAVRTKEWDIHQESLTPKAIKHFHQDELYPYKIDHIDKKENVIKSFLINLKEDLEFTGYVESFTSLDALGNIIGNYHESKEFLIEDELRKQFSSEEGYTKALRFYKSKREPVVIIDTGFDITHKDLTKYLYNSPKDIAFDGVDNDGNGRIDDGAGWHMQDDAGLDLLRDDNNIRETHFLTHTPYPISHGTHVAAEAFSGTKNYGLVGFAGDVAIAKHLRAASDYIKENDVGFVNMSFSLGVPGYPMSPPKESFVDLENIIKSNPKTLFTVAAGNGRIGLNLDFEDADNYPASYAFKNMLVIGALNTASYEEGNMESYKRAFFSKYGEKTVDIFAPGKGVMSAHSGGGEIALNGTSMASPYALNIILKAKEINPKLTPLELKKLVMETAFIPKKRLPCVSGGMINPEKLYEAVRATVITE